MSKKKEIKKLQEKVNRLLCDLGTAYGDIENLINAYPDGANCLDARFRHSTRYNLEKYILLGKTPIDPVDNKKPLVYHDSEGIYGHLASKEIKLFKVPEAGISSQPEIEARIQRQKMNDRHMVWGSPADYVFKSERFADKEAEHNPGPDKGSFPCIDKITVTERLYYHANPDTIMNVPSSFYETVEKWFNEWNQGYGQTNDDFYKWCILNKRLTPLI